MGNIDVEMLRLMDVLRTGRPGLAVLRTRMSTHLLSEGFVMTSVIQYFICGV